jgi:hypothetical protein
MKAHLEVDAWVDADDMTEAWFKIARHFNNIAASGLASVADTLLEGSITLMPEPEPVPEE